MDKEQDIYYNEFFEGVPKLSKEDLKNWYKENDRKKKTFVEHPTSNNLTKQDIWEDRAKFYFLPFLTNCYKFTRQNKLPHFALMCSPTFIFYRDRLHLRNYMDTIHKAFFRCLEMCIPKDEPIMLLVEKRFHIDNPIDGGTQQLYNMLWDYDLSAIRNGKRITNPKKVILPPRKLDSSNTELDSSARSRLGAPQFEPEDTSTYWNWPDLNPAVPYEGVDLCRRTCWLEDDLQFLSKKYYLSQEKDYPEIVDVSGYSDEKKDLYAKTARRFYFRLFEPKYVDEDVEIISSDSDLDDLDDDDFDIDSTQLELLDSTLDFEQED